MYQAVDIFEGRRAIISDVDRMKEVANQTSSAAVLHPTTPGILKLILLYGRKNVNTSREQYADYSTRRATTSCFV